ncbi:MAG: FAD-binding protein, partial [Desulfobacterales bacterium]
MLNAELISNLRHIVGETRVSVSRADTELYSYDASLAKGHPGVIVFPADTREVARVVRVIRRAGVPFVPRGFGTNLSGGTVLPSGGVVICLSRLNRIIDMSPERRCAVVQPGVTNLELQNALAPLGFFYAPDPASQKVATLGGNVGENSGGPRCLRYGVTTNHILGLDVVLSSGEVVRVGGCAYDPPGYDLRGALIGSEGTMGIVTEVTVRILPLPENVITLLVIYDDIGDAARSVSDIISAGIIPTTLEMMDAPIINAVEDSYACGYPRDAAAVLIVEV